MQSSELAALRGAYGRFLNAVPGRILLSGHSHQAWPDVAREAQLEVFDDAARLVDDKWQAVFEVADEVRKGVLHRMGFDETDDLAFGESTHQLIFRLLSALAPTPRLRIVTTTGEFHSLFRQLSRIQEDGAEVVWVQAQPREGLADRILEALTPGTSLLALSAVMFEDSYVVPRLPEILARAAEVGALPLVDAYHAFNAVPLSFGAAKEQLYVAAGGYKYAGIGNGLCWLRIPKNCDLRPRYTGWFADFGSLAQPRRFGEPVAYGAGGARFGGATFAASALYRARAVLRHWKSFGLDVAALRKISGAQTARIIRQLDDSPGLLPLVSSRDPARRGAFVTVHHPEAGRLAQLLGQRGVVVDARGQGLRFGPAPYLTNEEIDEGVGRALELQRELAG